MKPGWTLDATTVDWVRQEAAAAGERNVSRFVDQVLREEVLRRNADRAHSAEQQRAAEDYAREREREHEQIADEGQGGLRAAG
jgi:hypothetical protein